MHILENKIVNPWAGHKDLAAYVWQTATKEEIAKARADYEGFYKENKIEYTEELLQSEIVARLVGERLQSEKFLKRYAEKDASLLKKATGFLSDLRKSIKSKEKNKEAIESTGAMIGMMDLALSSAEVRESDGGKKYFDLSTADNEYIKATVNKDILDLVEKVERGDHKKDDNVDLGQVSEKLASDIQKITGIDVNGFKIMVEARLIEHILIDHGKNGKTDRTMSDYTNIAKMEYTINNYDAVSRGKSTQAYKNVVDGKTRGAQTVLYEKSIGDKSYYVIQAVPDTKARTLFVVSTFIGEKG